MRVDWNALIPTRRSLLSRLKHWDDQKSWEDFHDIYYKLIFGAAIKAGLTEVEAQDAAQDTIVAVAKGIKKFHYDRKRCTFKTWLHGITRRQVANQFRKRQGKGRLLEPLIGREREPSVEEIPDPVSEALAEALEMEWEQSLLDAAIERVKKRVSPAQFQIFDYLRQGHSTAETVSALGANPARVYLAKHRISKEVQKEVAVLKTKYG